MGRDERSEAGAVAAAAVLYFAVVFAVGFVLGTVRVLLVVPVLGERPAELIELPVMIAASYFAAGWVLRRSSRVLSFAGAALAGVLALALLVATELTLVLLLRGITLSRYLAERDRVAGIAYLAALLIFGALPGWLAHRAR